MKAIVGTRRERPNVPAAPAGLARRSREWVNALILITPFFLLLFAFTIYPAARALLDSFKNVSALNPASSTWVGLAQYTAVLHDGSFRHAVGNNFVLMAVSVPIQSFLALILASALNSRIRAQGFFRAVYFLPYITAPVAIGAVMVFLFGPNGALTRFLHAVLETPNTAWYASENLAFWLVVGVMIWTEIGFFTVIYLAGLQSISKDVYEAAALDGASPWTTLWKITIPLVRPTTALVILMGIIVSLQTFEQPYVLSTTGGALPGSPSDSTLTMVMYLYAQAFRYQNLGQASAAAFLIMIVILTFSAIMAIAQRRGARA
jgi:multiple sugar transport system permease protein